MKRIYAASAIAAFGLGGAGWMAPASAAPPTVTPSPGYDARLQEQRAAQAYHARVYEPACVITGRRTGTTSSGSTTARTKMG